MIDTDVRVDFTPSWWPRHCHGKTPASRALVGRAIALVLGDMPGAIHNVQANARNLHAFVVVPTDVRLSFVEEVRNGLLGRIETLEREAIDSAELLKPTSTLLVENVLWRKAADALAHQRSEEGRRLIDEITRLREARNPITMNVGGDWCTRPVRLQRGRGDRWEISGYFPGDMAVVITGFSAQGNGHFDNIWVTLLVGITIRYEATLLGLLKKSDLGTLPPLWVPPRQCYEVQLINRSDIIGLELERFVLHGFDVDFDYDRDVRERQI